MVCKRQGHIPVLWPCDTGTSPGKDTHSHTHTHTEGERKRVGQREREGEGGRERERESAQNIKLMKICPLMKMALVLSRLPDSQTLMPF